MAKITRTNILLPVGGSHRMKCSCAIWKLQYVLFRSNDKCQLFIKKYVKLKGQGHRVRNNGTHGKVLSLGSLMWNINDLALTAQKLLARLMFSKNKSNSKVKVTGLKIIVPRKGLVTRNIHLKYQSSSFHCSKVINKVKVFKKWVKLQGQGHRLKNNGTNGKDLSQGILM